MATKAAPAPAPATASRKSAPKAAPKAATRKSRKSAPAASAPNAAPNPVEITDPNVLVAHLSATLKARKAKAKTARAVRRRDGTDESVASALTAEKAVAETEAKLKAAKAAQRTYNRVYSVPTRAADIVNGLAYNVPVIDPTTGETTYRNRRLKVSAESVKASEQTTYEAQRAQRVEKGAKIAQVTVTVGEQSSAFTSANAAMTFVSRALGLIGHVSESGYKKSLKADLKAALGAPIPSRKKTVKAGPVAYYVTSL